jgi:hypothetical protein
MQRQRTYQPEEREALEQYHEHSCHCHGGE